MINDVRWAYFSALARRQVFVEPSDEDKVECENMVGELSFSMDGTKDARQKGG